jgi:transposase InsO family protein
MAKNHDSATGMRWARLRFSIVGRVLAMPAKPGELQHRLQELAQTVWKHPTTGESVAFSFSTIERWYYLAYNHPKDPVNALLRRVRVGAGAQPSVSLALARVIVARHQLYPTWSYQLHYDNISVLAKKDAELENLPSYSTICRFMKKRGLAKQKKRRQKRGKEPDVTRERRSFEVEHVHALWHLDFHQGSRSVLTKKGEHKKPWLAGIIDDRSRLVCHLQWYFAENTENLVHCLSQAIQKRGIPRSLLTDNGGAMLAAETEEGLVRLSIKHWTTLAETPEQNGKQENFWVVVEGRLLAMLQGEKDLDLALLNQATQAWVERDHNNKLHSEIGETPYDCCMRERDLARPSPSSAELRAAFRLENRRRQRQSDCTISVEGTRFELPHCYRNIERPTIRYARWDLSQVELVDERSGKNICTLYPLDKRRNASGHRKAVAPTTTEHETSQQEEGMAPLLKEMMEEQASTGLTSPYLPTKEDRGEDDE